MSEYAILMDKRDEDLSLIKSEIIDLEKDLKGSKNDIFEEQKKFIELQMKKEYNNNFYFIYLKLYNKIKRKIIKLYQLLTLHHQIQKTIKS